MKEKYYFFKKGVYFEGWKNDTICLKLTYTQLVTLKKIEDLQYSKVTCEEFTSKALIPLWIF